MPLPFPRPLSLSFFFPILPFLSFFFLLPPPAPAQTVVRFYQRGYVTGGNTASTTLTDAAVSAFEKANPDIRIHVTGLPWSREGDLKLRAVLLNGSRIDLFRVTNNQLPDFIPRKGRLLSPADDHMTEADFKDISPGALDAVRHNGRIMAWPLWSTAICIVANVNILKDRGIEIPERGPWTWNEFINVLRKTTFINDSRDQVYGFTVAARPPYFEWSPLVWAHSGPVFEGGNDSLVLCEGLENALGRAAELKSARVVPPTFGTDDQAASQAQFLDGRATFLMTTPAFIRTLAAREFPYIIIPPPLGDFGPAITTGALGCFAVVAHPGDPAREAAAHAFARYLTSAQVADDVPGWYLAPPVRASVDAFESDPAYAGLMPVVRLAVYINPPGGGAFMESVFIPAMQAALMGERTPSEAIGSIRAGYERMSLN